MIDIQEKKDCVGCWSCVQRCPKRCISMREDREGFLYPAVDASLCIDCGLCEKVCPVIRQDAPREPLGVYAAINRDDEIRLASSSGGVFTLLAEAIIRKGGVVFGAGFNENWEVVHSHTETLEGLAPFRGSKYVQSRIGNCYKEAEAFLKSGREVLFSGTPCQIAGLRRFLRKDYPNLTAVDFICHGAPSPGIFRQYLEEQISGIARQCDGKISVSSRPVPSLSEKGGLRLPAGMRIEDISFRDKRQGWKKYSFVLDLSMASAAGGKNTVLFSYSQTFHENAFMRGFLRDLYLRPSCHACPAKELKSGADLTLGDYWGIGSLMPELDDDKSVGVVIVNSERGENLLGQIEVELHEAPLEDVAMKNPSLLHPVGIPANRAAFFAIRQGGLLQAIVKSCRLTFRQRMRNKLSHILRKFLGKRMEGLIKKLLRRDR